MNPDGTSQAQLTSLGNVADPTGVGGALAWSPDSSKLLFVRGSGPYAIWVVECERIERARAHVDWRRRSPRPGRPTGTQIVFVESGGSAIDVMNADGSNVARS